MGATASTSAANSSIPITAASSQLTATTSLNNAVSTGQKPSDAYHEQFHRYSYYYGEEEARKYYGAWSPPVGTPNPYGTNPNGISAAPPSPSPVAAAIAAPASASTPASSTLSGTSSVTNSDIPRDTGRRGVSNLPAWMTAKQ